jgi:hypothetical protein
MTTEDPELEKFKSMLTSKPLAPSLRGQSPR